MLVVCVSLLHDLLFAGKECKVAAVWIAMRVLIQSMAFTSELVDVAKNAPELIIIKLQVQLK